MLVFLSGVFSVLTISEKKLVNDFIVDYIADSIFLERAIRFQNMMEFNKHEMKSIAFKKMTYRLFC